MAVRITGLALISALILGGLFLLLRPDSPRASPERASFDLEIRGDGMEPAEVSVREDDTVTLSVTADHQAEVHIHGYDFEEKVEPGDVTKLSFEADSTGRFPIEDHATGAGLGFLVVEPR